MSNAFAIAAVSAVLQQSLRNVLGPLSSLFGTVMVTAKAPDLVQNSLSAGTSEPTQLNLFLHQVTHNPGWRNVDLPSLGTDGRTALENPPLALDLHYLLTAYGSEDWQAEALLGHALQMLHRFPVIARADINKFLSTLPASAFAVALGASGLADQLEMIKLTPSPLNREEMAWLWTALKADYRPTFPFQASVVLIEPQATLGFALPVLSRNIGVAAIEPAQLLGIVPPEEQLSAASGDLVTISGEFLKQAAEVVLVCARLGVRVVATATNVSNTSLQFVVPADTLAAPCPAGIYTAAVNLKDASGKIVQTTNSLPFAVAPVLQLVPAPVQTGTETIVTATFTPVARPNQKVSLAIGNQSATSSAFTTATGTLTFSFVPPLAAGKQLGRLVVDGAPSQVKVKWPTTPGGTPTFDQTTWLTI